MFDLENEQLARLLREAGLEEELNAEVKAIAESDDDVVRMARLVGGLIALFTSFIQTLENGGMPKEVARPLLHGASVLINDCSSIINQKHPKLGELQEKAVALMEFAAVKDHGGNSH